ncbi:hypothetical protein ACFSCX_07210 [Bacillus salitolerans]|uniref:Lipoprotein n=1 Tax=Bacillus salitolerans TaxID=1437434 RepID=A0ABW4LME2_9BACI
MSKYLLYVIVLLALIGCSNEVLSEGNLPITENKIVHKAKPPNVYIETGNSRLETTLGTYCWHVEGKGTCVDTVGPIDLLKGKKPLVVKAGEKIHFVMDYEPKPNKFHLLQIHNNSEEEVEVKNEQFLAPTEKGIYYYSYGVWWLNQNNANVSKGDAFYAFVIEVK